MLRGIEMRQHVETSECRGHCDYRSFIKQRVALCEDRCGFNCGQLAGRGGGVEGSSLIEIFSFMDSNIANVGHLCVLW